QNFTLEGQILNFLSSVNDVKVTITSRNPNVTLQNNQFEVESFQSGNALDLGSMGIVGNVSSGAPDNLDVLFDVEFSNSDFKRTYFITNLFNSTIYSFSENNITSTISGNGRIGFNNPNNASKIGNGVIFDDINYLLAHGITIVQKNTDRFLDNTFNDRFSINSDFNISKRFTNKANKRAQNEINGMFADSFVEATRKLGLNIEYNLLINSTVEDENYFIYELILENTSGEDRDSLYLGHFFNLQNLPDNEIDLNWNDGNSVIASMENKNAFLAFTLLNKDAAASFFNREDFDFSYESKRNILLSDEIEENSLSNSFYIKSQVFSLDAGKKDTIAIAIHAAFTLDEIYESIENSLFYYNQKLKVPQFEDNIITICGSNNLIIPNYNQGQLRWYRNYTDVDPFFTGTGLQINGVKRNTLLYVSRVINGRESIKKEVKLEVSPQTSLNNSGSVKICEGDSLLLELPDQSAKYLWNDGVTTNRSKYVNKPGEYFAFISNDNGCENYSDTLVLSIHPPPPSLQMSEINQRDICLQNELIVDFSNQLNSKESVLAQIADTFFINGISLPITINNPNTDIKFFRINEFGCKSEFASPEFVVKGEIPLISYDDGQLKTNIENADLYEWYLDNQLVGTGQFFTPLSLGTYFVEVSKSGCINRSEDYEVLITSIVQDDEYSKHLIYPNPTNKYVSILLKNKSLSEIVDVYILDVLGNKLLPRLKSTSENIIELDVSNLSTGVYNVVLQEKNGSIVIRKFQKN
ncbi:MAG: T9SS type A sorting domain-containing protein, partial [Cyclobacteriaceae bacterium]